ncbi:rRNA maturation RNase YbeY [Mesoaciditoga lauensis]|uniref:rRNA maturation RNase YbeY n=1 Tax=Mesoaciditoga lauensis TaxID=1495039 RepID=UPI00068C83CF|nr:rRNA maturation RNase YbeY [Mesoaciditoga lauensis]
MRKCEVFNAQQIPLNVEMFQKLCDYVLKREKREGTLNVVFVGLEEISEYNRYRKKEGPTDVLSFEGDPPFLGEIYICPEYVKENAKYFKVPFEEEMIRVCIHGILHLLGYDHERDEKDAEKMFDIQERYVADFSTFFDKSS